MNTYLLNIFSLRLLEEELSKIINKDANVIRMNFDECSLDDVLNECAYFSLIDEEKIVIVNNFKLNSSTKTIENYLNNPNKNTKLILIVDTIDKRNSIYKLIKEKGHVIIINELQNNDLINKINKYCLNEGIKIDYQTINKLMENNLNNYDLVLNEIDKIKIITNEITLDKVDLYGSSIIDEDNFGLCDAITKKDYKASSKLLNDFISNKEEVIPFIALLASQYRLIYTVKCLSGSPDMIASKLNIHPYRVKLAKEKSYNYNKEDLLRNLELLYELDYELKSTSIDPYSLLKIFLINA